MTVASESKILGVSFPDDWLRNKIGRITTKVGSGATPKGGASAYQPTGMPLIRSLNVHNEGFRSYNLAFINDDHARQLEYASVEPGDVLLNITGASILRSAVVPAEVGPARVNQHVSIVRPDTDQVLPGYLHAWLISPVMYSYMYSLSVGSTREAITKEQILRFPIVFPTLEEQRSIISYLESKTAAIDGIIGKLQREVELLERYRRELIAHTVTRGLDPDVPMKDSGFTWIGHIPEHWATETQKRLLRRVVRPVGQDWRGYRLLSMGRGGVVFRDVDSGKGKFPASFEGYQEVRAGEIVMCLFDMDETPRTVGLSGISGMITGAYDVFQVSGADERFVSYWLRRLDDYKLWRLFYRSLRKTITPPRFLALPIPLPPRSEQKRIADFLDAKMAELDATSLGIKNQSRLLGKYRKQVINDAVTGKVRVGGEA